MMDIPKTIPHIFTIFLCLFCSTFLWAYSLCATPISTFDSAGEPFNIDEEIEKDPIAYIAVMEEFLRQGKLDAMGLIGRRLALTKNDDPRGLALFSIFLASKGNINDSNMRLQEAKLAGDTPYILYTQAMILRLEKKLIRAKKVCKEAISMDPDHPYPWNVLGRIQFDQGEVENAYASFQKSVELEPNFLPGYINLGATAHTLGNNDDAVKHFKRALEIAPQASSAHFGLGLVYSNIGQYTESSKQFVRTVELDPENHLAIQELGSAQINAKQYVTAIETGKKMQKLGLPDAYLVLGEAALHLGKTQDAIQYLEQASPNRSEVDSLFGFCYMAENQYDKALTYMDNALKSNPNNFGAFIAKAGIKFSKGQSLDMDTDLKTGWGESLDKASYFSRGCVLASNGEWAAATVEWQRSENIIQGFSLTGLDAQILSQGMIATELPHLNLGMLYFYKNLYAPAFAEFTTALDKNKDSILSNYWTAQVFLNQGDRSKAILFLEKALKNAPNFFTALYTLAELNFMTGKPDQAAKYYHQALKVKSDTGILLKLALYYENKEQFSEAEKYYRELIEQESDFYVGYNQLAWLYAKRGVHLEKALDLAHRANELRSGNGSVLDTMGWIHYHKKEYDKAMRYLKESEQANPFNATVIFHIGLTYQALGDLVKSHAYMEKALKINDQFDGAEKAKEILNNKNF